MSTLSKDNKITNIHYNLSKNGLQNLQYCLHKINIGLYLESLFYRFRPLYYQAFNILCNLYY